MKVTVLGMGSWGTALAQVLADNGHQVLLWGRDENLVKLINETRTNPQYLPGNHLSEKILATSDMGQAVQDTALIVVVIPTKGIREVMQSLDQVLDLTNPQVVICHASKGIEKETHYRISQIIEQVLTPGSYSNTVVLSGPSHAEEVIKQQPTTVVSASLSLEAATMVQKAFMNDYFRVYTNQDIIGVELGGALKNIIAIGSGLISGLGYGDNTKAALMTRGLAEISRLGTKVGADPLTFSGLSGMGDLIVTCTSQHSRNFRAGLLFAQGKNRKEVEAEVGMVVEGISTCQVAHAWSQELGVDMPITQGLYSLIFEEANIQEGVKSLMSREGKSEASIIDHLIF